MSRFFATGSDSESSTDESYSSRSESENESGLMSKAKQGASKPGAAGLSQAASKYLAGASKYASGTVSRYLSDSDEDDSNDDSTTKRVVKSQLDKQKEEWQSLSKSITTNFDKMAKLMTKFVAPGALPHLPPPASIQAEDSDRIKLPDGFRPFYSAPREYIKAMADIEGSLRESSSESKKKLNASVAKAMTVVKQKVKKIVKSHEWDMIYYSQNMDQDDSHAFLSDYGSDASASDNAPKLRVKKEPVGKKQPPRKPAIVNTSDSASDRSESGSESDSDVGRTSESEDKSVDGEAYTAKPVRSAADKWKKREPSGKSARMAEAIATARNRMPRSQKKKVKVVEDGGGSEEDMDDASLAKLGKDSVKLDITPDNVMRKLREVMSARGKKNTDRSDQIATLRLLLDHASHSTQKVRILFSLISSQFDLGSASIAMAGILTPELWKRIDDDLKTIMGLLESSCAIDFYGSVDEDFLLEERAFGSEVEKLNPMDIFASYVHASLASAMGRFDDEFNKSLVNLDPHSTEYVDRLKDEASLYALLVRVQAYFSKSVREASLSSTVQKELLGYETQLILRRLERIYCKPSKVADIFEASLEKLIHGARDHGNFLPPLSSEHSGDSGARAAALLQGLFTSDSSTAVDFTPTQASKVVHRLACYLYANGSERLRARAMLMHVYHYAFTDRFTLARDLLLMSHLQESIGHADVSTQILYNRALVQIGLAAFREGRMKDCQAALQELFTSGRQRELLAQSLPGSRYGPEKSLEQEKLERSRQLPFHMHINLELLEAAFLVASMLTEMPYTLSGSNASDSRGTFAKRGSLSVVNKHLRRLLEINERSLFNGPPETTRDHIIAACRALMAGDWESCVRWISSITIWDLMGEPARLRSILATRIKEECLHAYLLSHHSHFCSLGLAYLSSSFDLSPELVKKLLYKWIANDELPQAWVDENSTDCCWIHFDAPTTLSQTPLLAKLHVQSLALAEKAALLVEDNERALETPFSGLNAPGLGASGGADGGNSGPSRRDRDNFAGSHAYHGSLSGGRRYPPSLQTGSARYYKPHRGGAIGSAY